MAETWSDGFSNFIGALTVAGCFVIPEVHLFRGDTEHQCAALWKRSHNLHVATFPAPLSTNQVTVFFSDKLYRGNRCTKGTAFAFDAFLSPNFPPLLELGAGMLDAFWDVFNNRAWFPSDS
jgi:L-asparaginase/Glu-tRNA(Gln) amidotransferase subunit D